METPLRAGQTPLEPLVTLTTPGSRGPRESDRTSVVRRDESDDPGAWTELRQTPVLRPMDQAAAMGELNVLPLTARAPLR